MLTYKEVFRAWNKELNQAIINNSDFQKAKAFGKSERFLLSPASLELNEKRMTKFGLYAYEMDKGRGRTKNPSGGLWQGIYDWLSLKKYGIQWKNDKERRGIAFAITKKIGKEGTYKRNNPAAQTDIYGKALQQTFPLLEKDLVNIQVKDILYAI